MNVTFGILFALIILAYIGSGYMPWTRDNTDSDKSSSGLVVFVDQKTGVNYVANIMGGMTVRVDETGAPIIDHNPWKKPQ